MEATLIAIIPVIVKIVTEQMRADILHMLMGSKCCKWSKNKMKKLHDMLDAVEPDLEIITEAVSRISGELEKLEYEDEEVSESVIKQYINQIWPPMRTTI